MDRSHYAFGGFLYIVFMIVATDDNNEHPSLKKPDTSTSIVCNRRKSPSRSKNVCRGSSPTVVVSSAATFAEERV